MKSNIKNIFVGLMLCLAVTACNPSKVTDPSDPRFDIMKFDGRDYDSYKDIAKVFEIHFPIGTDKKFIENILVIKAKISISRSGLFEEIKNIPALGHGYNYEDKLKHFKAKYYVVYDIPTKTKFSITPGTSRAATAYYDESDKLLLMFVGTKMVHETTIKTE